MMACDQGNGTAVGDHMGSLYAFHIPRSKSVVVHVHNVSIYSI